jgi:23S rRNA (cytosine1962-C5)-methyltransferase
MSESKHLNQVIQEDLTISGWADYELLDSGNQQKLERFGPYRLNRFEPEAVWKPALDGNVWKNAHARFSLVRGENQGGWTRVPHVPETWSISLEGLRFNLFLKQSRHIGIFPEQLPNWQWMKQIIKNSRQEVSVLNLFAYTGAATAFSALAGAKVTHVEAARSALSIAKKNLDDSDLVDSPVRWIVDDAFKFVQKEIRRGNHYDAIIMDPPKFGRGPAGEVWKFSESIGDLIGICADLLSQQPLFFILTAYDVDLQPSNAGELLKSQLSRFRGKVRCGNLIQQEKSAGRKIRQSIYARWERL